MCHSNFLLLHRRSDFNGIDVSIVIKLTFPLKFIVIAVDVDIAFVVVFVVYFDEHF